MTSSSSRASTGRFECLIEKLEAAIDPAQEAGVDCRGVRGVRELARPAVPAALAARRACSAPRRAFVELPGEHQLLGERRERGRSCRCRLWGDRHCLFEGLARAVRVATRAPIAAKLFAERRRALARGGVGARAHEPLYAAARNSFDCLGT